MSDTKDSGESVEKPLKLQYRGFQNPGNPNTQDSKVLEFNAQCSRVLEFNTPDSRVLELDPLDSRVLELTTLQYRVLELNPPRFQVLELDTLYSRHDNNDPEVSRVKTHFRIENPRATSPKFHTS
ncbi:uncharacterized protein LOC143146140 [Ptiloglossa arizonensis]|uniref:uncharacterized protein LOC143146140 n=1 Tax=Ptiloglossa arizonensis TaxID=3350558 RepID=UPI003FA18F3F